MKYIKLFENFKDKEELEEELNFFEFNITNHTINDDLTIDVDGDVVFYGLDLYKIPFKFGKVTGNFICNSNKLESLEGCPYYVGKMFNCSSNNLKSLEYGPKEVGGPYDCTFNELDNLDGIAPEIGDSLYCHDNNITNLDIISNIEGDIYCGSNNLDPNEKDSNYGFRGYCKEIINPEIIIVSESIRRGYEDMGVQQFYSKNKNTYTNPHLEDVKKCLDLIIDKVSIGKFLDLGCGNGEVSNYLNKNGFKNFKGLDPHFSEIYKSNFNKECFNLTFEEVSKNGLPESFDTIIASYSIHLCDKSYFDNLLYNISLNCRIFVVISPNKNQNIESYFKKIYSQKIGKSNLIIYQSLLN